jgi:uncharacterized protein YjbI with pentapeptide repeats
MTGTERPSLAAILTSDDDVTDGVFEGEDILLREVRHRRFSSCAFKDCDFEGTTFIDCTFVDAGFDGCRFRDVRFVGCRFGGGKDEHPIKWRFCDLSHARFEDSSLALAEIFKCEAFETAFDKCSCLGLKFDADVHRRAGRTKMPGGVHFTGCRMQFSVFAPADYEVRTFESCDLRDVDFSRGNFTRVSFRGSVLHNADFTGATLDEADLTSATFDAFPLSDLFSFRGLVVGRDQQETMLASIGIRVAD